MADDTTPTKKVHVAVHLDGKDVEKLDRYANKSARSRSGAGAYLILLALRVVNAEDGS
jgi:hypothetical protein